jgi:hypothetical protein
MLKTARMVQVLLIAIVTGVSCTETAVTPPDVTGPNVAAVTPAAASTVSRMTTFRVTFSEAMTPSTVNTSTFLVRTSSGSDVPGTVTYFPATTSAEFVPAAMLPNATGIVVTITTGVRDQAGNPMAEALGFAFTVRDEIAPSVSSVSPADLATGVSVSASPVLKFSEAMDAATINSSSVTLRLAGTGATASGSVWYVVADRSAIFLPAVPLEPGSSYTVGVSTAAKDVSGNALSEVFASSFVTEAVVAPPLSPPPPPSPPSADDVAPTVIASTPANDSENIPVTSEISVMFSEAMSATTIDSSTFTLAVGEAPVSGTVTYSASSHVASFMPRGGLLADGKSYLATITTGVKDVAGNGLASDFVFAFTTARPVDSTPAGRGNAFLWVMVLDPSGPCIPDATIRVVSGQRAGEIVTQKTPCDAWADDGGFIFRDLIANGEMTLQASAPGYESQYKTVSPTSGPQTAFQFVLSRK